jgi:hypothetical protein
MAKGMRRLLAGICLCVLHSAPSFACNALWVRATGGEIKVFGKWRAFEPNAVTVECGSATSLPLYTQAGSFLRVGSELILRYDGIRLEINALAVKFEILPHPSVPQSCLIGNGDALRDVRIDIGPAAIGH